jgi:hypothetical protein
MNLNDPETRQQLYGGDIADHYPAAKKEVSPEKDLKNIGDIYQQMLINKNPLNLPAKLANKIQITS